MSDYRQITGIEVSADAIVKTAPNKAVIRVSISRKGRKSLQEEVKKEFYQIKENLMKNGIAEKNIEATFYSIIKIKDELLRKEYLLTHSFTVTTNDIDSVGKIVDLINEGDNAEVLNVDFGLDDRKYEQLKNEACKEAAKMLRDKAKSIASGAGAKLGKPIFITEGIAGRRAAESIIFKRAAALADIAAEPTSDIKRNELSVTARLNGIFNIS